MVITRLLAKQGTNGTDAVNLDQLNASRTIVKSSDGSVTVTPSESGLTKTYDLKVNLSNVAIILECEIICC